MAKAFDKKAYGAKREYRIHVADGVCVCLTQAALHDLINDAPLLYRFDLSTTQPDVVYSQIAEVASLVIQDEVGDEMRSDLITGLADAVAFAARDVLDGD
jgi:hypothetical protein